MNIAVHVFAVLSGLFWSYMIIREMRRQKITEFQSLGWLFAAGVVVLLGIFPGLIPLVAGWFGVWYPPTLLFAIVIMLMLFLIFMHTIEISQLSNRVNELSMLVSLLEHEKELLQTKEKEQQQGGQTGESSDMRSI